MINQVVVFEVTSSKASKPSSYCHVDRSISENIKKALEYYNQNDCPVRVLMGNKITDVTIVKPIPLDTLLGK